MEAALQSLLLCNSLITELAVSQSTKFIFTGEFCLPWELQIFSLKCVIFNMEGQHLKFYFSKLFSCSVIHYNQNSQINLFFSTLFSLTDGTTLVTTSSRFHRRYSRKDWLYFYFCNCSATEVFKAYLNHWNLQMGLHVCCNCVQVFIFFVWPALNVISVGRWNEYFLNPTTDSEKIVTCILINRYISWFRPIKNIIKGGNTIIF